jgi:hypothetical protein
MVVTKKDIYRSVGINRECVYYIFKRLPIVPSGKNGGDFLYDIDKMLEAVELLDFKSKKTKTCKRKFINVLKKMKEGDNG